MVANS